MGHLVGKDLYRKLGKKIDGQPMRAPWNDAFYAILKELYTPEEAEVIIQMPYGLSNLDQIEKATGLERVRLQKILDSLIARGLVMDIWFGHKFSYMISPLVIGIFEFTMMRTGEGLNTKHWAHLFHDYMETGDAYYRANCGDDKRVFPLRALPHEGTVDNSDHVEVMDYEKASAIIDSHKIFAVGLCSCRHEKLHLGEKKCDVPLETCTTMGPSAYYMIHHGLAKKISKTEMHELLAKSREMGLVICADNIKDAPSFFCNCCGCCCNVMLGISKYGYAHSVVTSNFIAECKSEDCAECGNCALACPINAITMKADGYPKIDSKFCMGCGVCALKCGTGAIRLIPRKQRVLHPEDTFERVILQCLERGTLQNQLFTDTQSVTHAFMRGFVGGFLKLPPVKKALMSDTLRSSFLDMLRNGQR